ncbi:MAG: alpha/beta hydrolase [Eubacteriales bacterium]|nr:alpha/beta hydrolase [Eubacteriales bacterium]
MTLAEFRRAYPVSAFTVSGGKPFTYRYYKNPNAKATLVLLTGGIGLSDLFYRHFARFARDFSVLTFDYQLPFADNGEFADAVAELLCHLQEKAWLVGQSLGGVVAQIIASRHPEAVEGLVLSNTCSLSGSMSEEGYQELMKMIVRQRALKKWLPLLPFPLMKRMIKRKVMKKTDGFTAREKAAMEELCDAMLELLTKPYERHMIDFLCDAEHYFGMTRDDFAPWEGKVLLILSEDDATFPPACKQDLIALMPHPTVITDLTGGHLALLVRLESYADLVTGFIQALIPSAAVLPPCASLPPGR